MTATPTQDVIDALNAAGLKADWAYTPSEVTVSLDGAELLLTHSFNVEGWECAVDRPGHDQYGVKDGPAKDAPATDVVAWVQQLIADGLVRA